LFLKFIIFKIKQLGRVIAIDYGAKRVGIAVTDSLKMIASALITVDNTELWSFLVNYFTKEDVEIVVLGLPLRLNNELSEIEPRIQKLIRKIAHEYPQIKIERQDERFTSKLAVNAMIEGGMKKKQRQVKGNVDKISATLILQDFLERSQY
jgi:putative Holliday junction resolvase